MPSAPGRSRTPTGLRSRTSAVGQSRTSVDGQSRTPAHYLARAAASWPSSPALLWSGGRLTYRELDERVAVMARRFRAARVHGAQAPRPTATLCMTPGPDAVTALFALWRAGFAAVPLHERLIRRERDDACATVRSQLHVDDANPGGLALRPADQYAEPDRGAGCAGTRMAGRALLADFPDVVSMILTSGSSGTPKAVGFGHRALAASARSVESRLRLSRRDRWGLCLSLGHVGGLSLVVRAVRMGSSVRLWPSFDAAAVGRAVLRGELTHVAVVPVMLRRILDSLDGRPPPDALRCVLVGGAAAPRRLLARAEAAGLPVATTWGMTETASQIATAPPDLARAHPGTAGRPLAGVEVRQAPNGLLQVSGPTLASAVVRGPDRAAEPLTDGPWFATRDLGRVDADGLVWVEGRADQTIVTGGLNVSPSAVERVIEEMPGVREAVVFGLPDREWGEIVAAVVEADPARVSAERVDGHCRSRLGRGRRPSRVAVAAALPRTLTGKVIRAEAARQLETASRPTQGTQ